MRRLVGLVLGIFLAAAGPLGPAAPAAEPGAMS